MIIIQSRAGVVITIFTHDVRPSAVHTFQNQTKNYFPVKIVIATVGGGGGSVGLAVGIIDDTCLLSIHIFNNPQLPI